MLLFGHIGFTLAAASLLNNSLPDNRFITHQEGVEKAGNALIKPVVKGPSAKFLALINRTKGLDLRFVIIGSLLPDIIDKPVGRYFFQDIYGSGRLYGHTLLFVLFLVLVGYIVNTVYKKSLVYMLAFGSFIHLILDFIFLDPHIFFWPLFGFTLEKGDSLPFGEWLSGLYAEFIREPWVAIPELIGAIIIGWFVWLLWRQKKIRSFIITGQV